MLSKATWCQCLVIMLRLRNGKATRIITALPFGSGGRDHRPQRGQQRRRRRCPTNL
ncbi:hypothetical protein MTBUT4_80020 [Magnetospirillum sp. UT-4]|nr:hypothetical protein MTBUT4_80020 [Magnetospirillum sp. UT-4]